VIFYQKGERDDMREAGMTVGLLHPGEMGSAVGANPIPILIPCHRVINADGGLGGYSSGLERKRWLLRHEKAI